jgi:hypothetical protein
MNRNIGLIADGPSDKAILAQLTGAAFNHYSQSTQYVSNYIELRQNIRDAIDVYWRKATQSNEYFFPAEHANDLLKKVVGILIQAYFDMAKEVNQISNRDILVCHSDAERHFHASDNFFRHPYLSLYTIIVSSTYKAYDSLAQLGYPRSSLPLILPIITFPSIDIVIAAAKEQHGFQFVGRNKNARELKMSLYSTENISVLTEDEFQSLALQYIDNTCFDSLFKHLPEMRPLLSYFSLLNT